MIYNHQRILLPSTILVLLSSLYSSKTMTLAFSPVSLIPTTGTSSNHKNNPTALLQPLISKQSSSTKSSSSSSSIKNRNSNNNQNDNIVLYMTSYNDNEFFLLPPDQTDYYTSKNIVLEERKKDWIDRSMQYYSTVIREDQRRMYGQISPEDKTYENDSIEKIHLATKHYFALRLVKSGKLNHAETLYRRIIGELIIAEEEEGGSCDHAKLAVSTLLLALLLQRMGDYNATRSVFSNFFMKVVVDNGQEEGKECACSAKVLQAYALFEMKRGHSKKSLKIVKKAVKMDKKLAPVLKWKLFRDVIEQIEMQVEESSSSQTTTVLNEKCLA